MGSRIPNAWLSAPSHRSYGTSAKSRRVRSRYPTPRRASSTYIPSFVLVLWATPQKRERTLWALNVATGDVEKRKPGKVALEEHLYTLDKNAASISLVIEAFLGVVEPGLSPAKRRRRPALTVWFFSNRCRSRRRG
jgi:hypothetical protein